MTKKTSLSAGITMLLLAVLPIDTPVYAQQHPPHGHVFGHVVDKNTNEHLPYANVVLYKAASGNSRTQVAGASTDANGHYSLHAIADGRYTLSVSVVGYLHHEQPVSVSHGNSQEIHIALEPSATRLEDINIMASRYETDRRTAATVVGTLSPMVMENTNSVNLAEGLAYQPGLRVENTCQNCGANSVRINGLDGRYSQILIDGRPVFSALAGVYGLEQIPASMIDRVEVIRGGGSSLFGANAIGGVINVITREPSFNSLDVAHTTSNHEGKAWDNVTSLNAALVSANHRAGAYIFGTHRARQGFDHDGDGYTELGRLRSTSLGMRSYYRMTDRSKLSLEYHNTYEFRRGGDSIDLQPHRATVAEQAEHNVNGGSLSYDFLSSDDRTRFSLFTSMQHIDRQTYYGTQYDPNAYGSSTDFSSVSGAQFNHAFGKLLFMPSQFIAGVEYSNNRLRDEQLAYHRSIDQNVGVASAFVQNEWKNDYLGLLLGARADKHSLMDRVVVSPRANVRYNYLNMVFRASYSSGFRAPQAFDEDLHIMAVGGDVAIITLSPSLRPEYSGSVSGSVGWERMVGGCDIDLLLEGFYTHINDVFMLVENGTDAAGNLLLERTNGNGAFVAGLNAEVSAQWGSRMGVQAGFTAQRSRYTSPEAWSEDPSIAPQQRMFRTPDLYGYLTANCNPFSSFSVALSGTFTGPMLVQHFAGFIAADSEVVTPSFFDLGVKLSYDWALSDAATLQVNGGVQNIFNSYQTDFDQGPNRDAGYIYGPNRPRTFFLGLKMSL